MQASCTSLKEFWQFGKTPVNFGMTVATKNHTLIQFFAELFVKKSVMGYPKHFCFRIQVMEIQNVRTTSFATQDTRGAFIIQGFYFEFPSVFDFPGQITIFAIRTTVLAPIEILGVGFPPFHV